MVNNLFAQLPRRVSHVRRKLVTGNLGIRRGWIFTATYDGLDLLQSLGGQSEFCGDALGLGLRCDLLAKACPFCGFLGLFHNQLHRKEVGKLEAPRAASKLRSSNTDHSVQERFRLSHSETSLM